MTEKLPPAMELTMHRIPASFTEAVGKKTAEMEVIDGEDSTEEVVNLDRFYWALLTILNARSCGLWKGNPDEMDSLDVLGHLSETYGTMEASKLWRCNFDALKAAELECAGIPAITHKPDNPALQ